MYRLKRFVLSLFVLTLFLFVITPSATFAQGLVEYALVLVIASEASPGTYEVCASNPHPVTREAVFAFQPSGISARTQPFDIQSISLELGPDETACKEVTLALAGVLCQLPLRLHDDSRNTGAVQTLNGQVRGCSLAEGVSSVHPVTIATAHVEYPALYAQIRRDLETGALLDSQVWLLGADKIRRSKIDYPLVAARSTYFDSEANNDPF